MSDSDGSSDDVALDLATVLSRRIIVQQLRQQIRTRKLSQQGNKFTLEQRLAACFIDVERAQRYASFLDTFSRIILLQIMSEFVSLFRLFCLKAIIVNIHSL